MQQYRLSRFVPPLRVYSGAFEVPVSHFCTKKQAPLRSDSYLLPEGATKVTYDKDTKIPNAGKFTILREDHTMGNLIRMQLLRDSNVTFSGYRHPHPLIHDITVRVQTNDASSPVEALANCLDDLSTEFDELAQKFRRLTGNSKDTSAFS